VANSGKTMEGSEEDNVAVRLFLVDFDQLAKSLRLWNL
jgi:hypothetical protein